MPELNERPELYYGRLVKCFRAVFPGLREDQIEQAAVDSTEAWDSIATANLLAVLEEEFEFQIDPDDYDELSSFRRIRSYLERATGTSA